MILANHVMILPFIYTREWFCTEISCNTPVSRWTFNRTIVRNQIVSRSDFFTWDICCKHWNWYWFLQLTLLLNIHQFLPSKTDFEFVARISAVSTRGRQIGHNGTTGLPERSRKTHLGKSIVSNAKNCLKNAYKT